MRKYPKRNHFAHSIVNHILCDSFTIERSQVVVMSDVLIPPSQEGTQD